MNECERDTSFRRLTVKIIAVNQKSGLDLIELSLIFDSKTRICSTADGSEQNIVWIMSIQHREAV
jgi:hypothetical protein